MCAVVLQQLYHVAAAAGPGALTSETNWPGRNPPVVLTRPIRLPGAAAPLAALFGPLHLGPNDSPIHRGDREDTGDDEARPDELGSGPAQPTVDPTAFGGTSSIRHPSGGRSSIEDELRDYDGIEVMEPTDGRLGLTNVNDVPPDDWAADTGETKTPDVKRS